jgi:hypothetical protein
MPIPIASGGRAPLVGVSGAWVAKGERKMLGNDLMG